MIHLAVWLSLPFAPAAPSARDAGSPWLTAHLPASIHPLHEYLGDSYEVPGTVLTRHLLLCRAFLGLPPVPPPTGLSLCWTPLSCKAPQSPLSVCLSVSSISKELLGEWDHPLLTSVSPASDVQEVNSFNLCEDLTMCPPWCEMLAQ